MRVRRAWFVVWGIALAALVGISSTARAQEALDEREPPAERAGVTPLPLHVMLPEVRTRYYETLRRSPRRAFLLDLALPGAGSVYTKLYANTVVAATLSVAGAGLWIAGAVKHDDALWWSGAGTFAAGRLYGIVSAPIGARWFNAALQSYLGGFAP